MKRRIEEIRKRLAEQRRLSHLNHAQHQWIVETTPMERFRDQGATDKRDFESRDDLIAAK